MIESRLKHEDLLHDEPMLDDYLRNDELDLNDVIKEALTDFMHDLIERGYEVRRLSKRLYIVEAETLTASDHTSEWIADNGQRLRLVANVSNITTNPVISLYGRNTTSDTGTLITQLTTSISGEITELIEVPYKEYQVVISGQNSGMIANVFLISTMEERVHKLLCFQKAFNRMRIRSGNDMYSDKAREYMEMYKDKINNTRFMYDIDDDGTITKSEVSIVPNIVFSRG